LFKCSVQRIEESVEGGVRRAAFTGFSSISRKGWEASRKRSRRKRRKREEYQG
jgi:hypothetical protein